MMYTLTFVRGRMAMSLAVWLTIASRTSSSVQGRSLAASRDDWTASVFAGASSLSKLLGTRGGSSGAMDAGEEVHGRIEVEEEASTRPNRTNTDSVHNNSNETAATTRTKRRKRRSSLFPTRTNNSNETSFSIAKREFLDRISLVSSALLEREKDAVLDDDSDTEEANLHAITHQSDLTIPGRHISVVTTAALPWMTGTAVNPLLRAAYLVRYTRDLYAARGVANETVANSTSTSSKPKQWVTLVIPWLELEEDQEELYGKVFANEQAQEAYIRTWLQDEAAMPDAANPDSGLKLRFYPARYHPGLVSIFAMGNILDLIPDEEAEVCLLEEPEHLNFYRAPGDSWTKKFHYVVGIVHTNYKEYASAHYSGLWTAPAIQVMSSAMVRAYCHKVIKLSDVLQTFAPEKEETSNVHGVRSEFLKEGVRRAQNAYRLEDVSAAHRYSASANEVYFIGKTLWAKGLDIMLELEEYYRQCTGEYFAIDIYGSGPEQKQIMRAYHGRRQNNGNGVLYTASSISNESSAVHILGTSIPRVFSEMEDIEEQFEEPSPYEETSPSDGDSSVEALQTLARGKLQKLKKKIRATTESLEEFEFPKSLHEYRRQPIPASFLGRVDHASLKQGYKVFVNPSITEVLCTTTAEALAMGKFAIVPVHPSNTFFLRFPNCLAYRSKFEFVANLRWALTHEPEPLTPDQAHEFTWEAATERFVRASAVTHAEARERERLGLSKLDERIAWFHNELGKGVKGDTIRRVLGAGPASSQVKYLAQQQSEAANELLEDSDGDGGDFDESEEDEEEGLPPKLHRSSFASAIRATVTNGLPSLRASSG